MYICVLFFRKVSRTENLNGTAQESATDFAFRSFDTSREGHGKPQCKDTCRTHQDTCPTLSYPHQDIRTCSLSLTWQTTWSTRFSWQPQENTIRPCRKNFCGIGLCTVAVPGFEKFILAQDWVKTKWDKTAKPMDFHRSEDLIET